MTWDFRHTVLSGSVARGMSIAWLTLIVSLLITAWGWHLAQVGAEQNAHDRFHFRVDEVKIAIADRLRDYEAVLRGAQGLFNASDDVTREEWRAFVQSLKLDQVYPGIQVTGFAKRVSSSEKNAHIRAIRAEGFSGYTIWPRGERAEYLPVIYLEPFAGRNLRAFGYDIASEPVRRAALEQARDTGEAAISGKITLVQESGENKQAGFILFLPIYRKGAPTDTVEGRRDGLFGYVDIAFRMDDLMRGTLSANTRDVDVEIFDGAGMTKESLMYDHDLLVRFSQPDDKAVFSHTTSLDTHGHTWTLYFSSLPAFEASIDKDKPRLVLAGGTFISLLFFIIAWSLVSRKASLLAVNKQLKVEITERQQEKEVLQQVGQVLSAATGETFFRDLVRNLAGTLQMDYAFVGEVDQKNKFLIHVRAICAHGRLIDNFDYDLRGTPCENVMGQRIRVYSDGVQQRFPQDKLLQEMGGKSYMGAPLFDSAGEPIGLIALLHSQPLSNFQRAESILTISAARAAAELERRQADAQMRQLSSAVEQTADAVVITDRHGVIQYVNPAYEQITGYPLKEVLGKNASVVKSGEHGKGFYEELWRTVVAGQVFRGVMVNRKKDGSLYYEEKTITPLKDAGGNIVRFVSTGKDITQRLQSEERLHHLAHHDPLTGLPNRLLLQDRLKQAMLEAGQNDRLVAVMFLDLDRFKTINDTLGHDIGDALLKTVAERLAICLRPGDTVSRLGGDEFTLILANVAHVDDVTRVAQKILDQFISPFRIGGRDLFVSPSIGITLYPLDEKLPENLLKDADVAMYRAKELGGNRLQFYTPELNLRAARRLELETGLRQALERQEFILHYQPLVDMRTGRIRGMEALLRWQHPEFGLIPPLDFIPLAEEIGLIIPIGEWVLKTACAQIQAWHKIGFPTLQVAVNLSSKQLRDKNLIAAVRQALAESGLEPRYLDLELTESVLMQDMEQATTILKELKAVGISFSLDDFGTGYSSLSYLKRFPIDYLKIDRSFVRDITTDPVGAGLVKAIIAMANVLRIKVIAEGVETYEQLDFLRSHGCDITQGYFCSKPLAAEDFTELLQDWDRLRVGKCSTQNR
jgi:diguanylate cyclase (GGDEF)-like protein/PAS domain S-box-containing protein